MRESHRSYERRRRIFEVVAIVVVALILLGLTRLETRLFALSETLSEHREFITTIVYFALINLNVIFILVLSFLIFRNIVKLVVERRRGVIGSRLRTKLVVALVFFALAPTVLLFYVSMRFVTTSFEEWFSEKVQATMQQTREAGALVYKQDQRRMESLARIALQSVRLKSPDDVLVNDRVLIDAKGLENFEIQYGLYAVKVFDRNGYLKWSSDKDVQGVTSEPDGFVVETLKKFSKTPRPGSISAVEVEGSQDVVKGVAPIFDPIFGEVVGAVLTEERFETQILKSVETILADFARLRPGAQLIRLSYLILMVVMALLITFSATWMGFYVARGITGPLQSLAEATREVALGNYDVSLIAATDDETGQLVRSFNHMTKDLQVHRQLAEETQNDLRRSNEELDARRQYMEIILKNISGGVIAIDPEKRVTTFNHSAEQLLGIAADAAPGQALSKILGHALYEDFWMPIENGLRGRSHFNGQIELKNLGKDVIIIADASRIVDENAEDIGTVVVFDDASVVARAQRVAAWKEVARRIAHEIKNPITPIKLNAQRLLRRYLNHFEGEDREVFESCIETIVHQVDSLRDLVNEFSKFSRLPNVKPVLMNLNELIEEIADMFRMSYPDVFIDTSGVKPLPQIPLDREQIQRVFVNLMTNSMAAMVKERSGAINLTAELLENLNMVRVELSDNGCGIPKELWDRALEPYFSTKDEGTGLGLAIANQIVSDHGGYLRLTGNEPFGTKVIIELPVGERSAKSLES